MKSGFCSIIGRPNVGKSTILNAILGTKLSIVSDKSQTTRNTIKGIYNAEGVQIVFLDTPGIHKPHQQLGVEMNSMAYSASHDCDVLVLVVDSSLKKGKGDDYLKEHVAYSGKLLIVLNKIDLARLPEVEMLKKEYSELYPDAEFLETVATDKFNIDVLLNKIISYLPEGPAYYDTDCESDTDLYFRVSEIIREKSLYLLKDEVPHSIAVKCEQIKRKGKDYEVDCAIYVEKASQKGIVIGAQGKMIKRIGSLARKDIEELLGAHIFLDLQVKVKVDWRSDDKLLKEFGYKHKR